MTNFPLSFFSSDYLNSGLIIKPMTSNVGINGSASASSVNNTGTPAWRAFDNDTSIGSSWNSVTTAIPAWLKYTFTITSPSKVTSYQIGFQNSGFLPISWNFQGSNDGSTWNTLDTHSGQHIINNELFRINPSLQSSYSQYRIFVTEGANGPTTIAIPEMQIYGYV